MRVIRNGNDIVKMRMIKIRLRPRKRMRDKAYPAIDEKTRAMPVLMVETIKLFSKALPIGILENIDLKFSNVSSWGNRTKLPRYFSEVKDIMNIQ
jgi:hypothetical protein